MKLASALSSLACATLVTVGLVGSAAAEDLQIKKAEVGAQVGRQATIKLYLGKTGQGQVQKPVKLFWIAGANRSEIYSNNGRFENTVGGYMNTITVDLPAETGRLEVVAGDRTIDTNFVDNIKAFDIGGSDLSFERPQVQQKPNATPNRGLILEIINRGPSRTGTGCKVDVTLTELAAPKKATFALPDMVRGAKWSKTLPYNFRQSGDATKNKFSAQLTCAKDTIPGNNTAAVNLQ